MPYALDGYVVRRSELERVLGCKDKNVLAQIQPLADEVVEHSPVALEELVLGRKQRPDANDEYVYAFEALCGAVGRRVGEHNQAGTYFQQGLVAHLLYDLGKQFDRAGITDIFDAMRVPIRRTKALPIALENRGGFPPHAIIVASKTCAEVRAEILAGIGKLKPPFRAPALELYSWFGEVSAKDVLVLFYY